MLVLMVMARMTAARQIIWLVNFETVLVIVVVVAIVVAGTVVAVIGMAREGPMLLPLMPAVLGW